MKITEYFLEVRLGVDWVDVGPFHQIETANDVMKICHDHKLKARVKIKRTDIYYAEWPFQCGIKKRERWDFFHKSRTGQAFDAIIKVPFFAISSENIGIQIADVSAYILGARFTGNKEKIEFFNKIKGLEFISRTLVDIGGKKLPVKGFKVVKEKEAGDLFSLGKTK